MMVKVFQKNKNGKVELTIEQLEKVLNDAYWEGYNNNNKNLTWTYTSPNWYTLCNDQNITTTTLNESNTIKGS